MKACLSALVILLGLAALQSAAQDQSDILILDEAVIQLRVAPDVQPIPLPAAEEPVAEPAEEDAQPDADEPATETPADQEPELGVLKFHLMDGTIITGELTTQALPVSTEFGDLSVPIEAIESFAPGLSSHPKIDQEISKLISQLASPEAKTRDQAQAQLLSYGPGLLPELQEHADDPDTERKVRIATITEELLSAELDSFEADQGPTLLLTRLDQVVTKHFTIAGQIKQDTFTIASKFGELTVKLADIKGVERITSNKQETRKTVAVSGMDMTCKGYKKTGIRVNRGDRIIISADGRVTMSPWGSNAVSGPDGVPQNGMYNGKIPMGALAGRIGDSGEEFLVGSKTSFVATKSGVLHLGFAMQQNWSNYQFPGEYNARIRVVPVE